MSDLIATLTDRGLFQDATPGLRNRLARGPITGYVGFDPTADSLHVGNLVPVMGLAWLQRLGGRPIVVVGGGTGLVGDPSGKRSERPMLDREQVVANVEAIRPQLARFLDFEGSNPALLLNNADWLVGLRLLDFLRDTGKHFTVNYMLQKESVKSRMDTGISFTEFGYMLVQAHDFGHLYRTHDCELQMGGSDQWGNITAGIELVSRREAGEAHGLVVPLLTTADGTKFGKTEGGNIWLDPSRTSPYRFYQYWFNTDDRDVERLLPMFTMLPRDQIDAVLAEQRERPADRVAQRLLAANVTARVHDPLVADRVSAASQALFGNTELSALDGETLAVVAGEVRTIGVPVERLEAGIGIVDALVETGLASSKADARRGIQGGGFSINGTRVGKADRAIGRTDLLAGQYVALQKGRRTFALLAVR